MSIRNIVLKYFGWCPGVRSAKFFTEKTNIDTNFKKIIGLLNINLMQFEVFISIFFSAFFIGAIDGHPVFLTSGGTEIRLMIPISPHRTYGALESVIIPILLFMLLYLLRMGSTLITSNRNIVTSILIICVIGSFSGLFFGMVFSNLMYLQYWYTAPFYAMRGTLLITPILYFTSISALAISHFREIFRTSSQQYNEG